MVPIPGFRTAREHRPTENHGDHHSQQRSHVPPPGCRHPGGVHGPWKGKPAAIRLGRPFREKPAISDHFLPESARERRPRQGTGGRRERSDPGERESVSFDDTGGVMRRSTSAFVAACVGLLVIADGRAQTSNASRLAWGDPDLEGSWTNATLTPLQRAPELGTKAYFTIEE